MLAELRHPLWLKNWVIGQFVRAFKVDMSQALEPDHTRYASFNEFFTRALKPELRRIDMNNTSIVSPADGSMAQLGNIQDGKIIQAKNHNYALSDLLGGKKDIAGLFQGGTFATIYLAPIDYHRVHMPQEGRLRKMIYVPGKLFSVNNNAAENIPNLFARNERVICIFDTASGPLAVILVGAMIVGSIETVWHGAVTPPHSKQICEWNYDGEQTLQKGEEMGRFKLGSTVIILYGEDANSWIASMLPNTTVRMGEKIGETSET